MKYATLTDGEWVEPVMKGYKLMCCDCGSVHAIDFKVERVGKRNKLKFRAFRRARESAAARRKVQVISK